MYYYSFIVAARVSLLKLLTCCWISGSSNLKARSHIAMSGFEKVVAGVLEE